MSQSFANTNSLPLEWSLDSQHSSEWAWPKFTWNLEPFKARCIRFLRYPGLTDGLGYRAIRVGVIGALWIVAAITVFRPKSIL